MIGLKFDWDCNRGCDWDWQTDGIYMKPSVVEKDYSEDIKKGVKTVLVTVFYTEKRYKCCPNPANEKLMDSLVERHKNGFSTDFKTYKVPEYIVSNKESWFV